MPTKIVTAIAFKLFAIYVIVSAVIALPSLAGTVIAIKNQTVGFDNNILWPIAITIGTIIITFIAFKILWKLGSSCLESSSTLMNDDKDSEVQALERTLFLVLGVYFTVSAFVEFPNMATLLWARSQTPTGTTLQDYAWLVSVMTQFIIGLLLINKLDKWLLLLRNAGVK